MAEIAGLVLGAIPLLIFALEHSDAITGPFRRMMKWKKYRDAQFVQLNHCSVCYDQTLRLLLRNVVDEEELSEMLQDPQCGTTNLWLVRLLTWSHFYYEVKAAVQARHLFQYNTIISA